MIQPIRRINSELAAYLAGDPVVAGIATGGVYDGPVDVTDRQRYPQIFPAPAGYPDGPRSEMQPHVAVVHLQRVAAPGGRAIGGVVIYTRIEARALHTPDGFATIDAIFDAVDRHHGQHVQVGNYRLPLYIVDQEFRGPYRDDTMPDVAYAWQDCRVLVALNAR